jgi:membrane associated rhomboid family serine protease
MFFFPYHTDAPLYHYPIGTVLLIVINVLMFAATWSQDPQTYDSLILTFDTIQPTQWVTSAFMHVDIMHLAGNMLFLWSFGLIVEGKLGWYRFLPLYLGIAIVSSATVQWMMLGLAGGALGASTAIFGLIAIGLVWAPRNELSCIFIYFVRVRHVQVAVTTMAGFYLGLNIVFFIAGGLILSSEALHLLGFAVGAPIGIVILKTGWVDCEGWDLFSVWAGTAGQIKTTDKLREDARTTFAKTDAIRDLAAQTEKVTALELLRQHLAEGRPRIAYAVFEKSRDHHGKRLELPEKELLQLIDAMNAKKLWSELLPLLLQAIERFPRHNVSLRLHLAKILLQVEKRPRQSLAVLAKLPPSLPEEQRRQRLKIEKFARAAIDEGEMELEVKDW